MSNFPLIVSYYTRDTLYESQAQNLLASCRRWGLEHCIEPIATLGSWERNCGYKPFFLMQKLGELRRPLFWVDADAVFLREPAALDVFNLDFAARINSELPDDHPSKVMSGSLFINATSGAAQILRRWGQGCIEAFSNPERTEEVWDQQILRAVLLQAKEKVGVLPLSYVTIMDHPGDLQQVADPVIGHYQASRYVKKIPHFWF